MFQEIIQLFRELFLSLHLSGYQSLVFAESATFICLVLLAVVVYFIARFFIKRIVNQIIHRTDTEIDDILLRNKVIGRLSYYVPSFIISKFAAYTLPSFTDAVLTVQKTIDIYVIFVSMLLLSSIISSLYDFYNTFDTSKKQTNQRICTGIETPCFCGGQPDDFGFADESESWEFGDWAWNPVGCSDACFQRSDFGFCWRVAAIRKRHGAHWRLDQHAKIWCRRRCARYYTHNGQSAELRQNHHHDPNLCTCF